MKIYNYKYREDFAKVAGIPEHSREDTGVVAQELREVLPDAVKETGDVTLGNGQKIENMLIVNKVCSVLKFLWCNFFHVLNSGGDLFVYLTII